MLTFYWDSLYAIDLHQQLLVRHGYNINSFDGDGGSTVKPVNINTGSCVLLNLKNEQFQQSKMNRPDDPLPIQLIIIL